MTQQEKLLDLPLEDVIGDRFGIYSKYIIQERALPDVRDGLKPVQRRILYAMLNDGNTNEKPFRKSAKTVGNVIGNYHPHGDSSVYEAMVRMSQNWKVRNVLIEMHGNNGSVDGDPAAAMRYTEARLSAISSTLLKDIEKETVDFVLNFDETTEEPLVLPSRFPNLLVNGSTGISAGYATDIPPHHLGEIIDATIMTMENPECSLEDLMTVVKGPDFPTGGIIQGIDGIKKAYQTGKGKIVVRGRTEIEDLRGGKQQIVIDELPYEVNKANLVKKMEELRLDRKVEGVAEVRDETDRTGTRVIIELKKDGDAQGILYYYFKNTDLQITYNFNMVAIHNKTPKLMGLKAILDAYIEHQKNVINKRSAYDLRKAKARAHIVEGLIKAISVLDEVIATIRASKDKRDAKVNISQKFGFSEEQAEAIVSLQLYRLTNTDILTLQDEQAELNKLINELENILSSEKQLIKVIKKELNEIKKKFADPRRSIIQNEIEEIKVDLEVMIASEDVMTALTKQGYIKRSSLRSFAASNGEEGLMKDRDRILYQEQMNTTDTLLIFTDKGRYLYIPVHLIPDKKWKEMGQHVANIVPIDPDENVLKAMAVKSFDDSLYLTFISKDGMVKRTPLSEYKAQRYSKPLMGMKLKGSDQCIDVFLTDGKTNVLLVTRLGYGLWFDEDEISLVGQRAAGVKGINLKQDDYVVGGAVFGSGTSPDLLVATQRGAVKKMHVARELEKSSRARRGLVLLRELKSNPHRIAGIVLLEKQDTIWLETDKGIRHSVMSGSYKNTDRYSNGSYAVDQDEAGTVISVWKNSAESDAKAT